MAPDPDFGLDLIWEKNDHDYAHDADQCRGYTVELALPSLSLKELGFTGIGYAGVKGRSVLQEIGKNVLTTDLKSPLKMAAITGPIRSALKPTPLSGILILGMAAKTISDSAVTDLEAEATRRGQLGTITSLHAERFGKPGN